MLDFGRSVSGVLWHGVEVKVYSKDSKARISNTFLETPIESDPARTAKQYGCVLCREKNLFTAVLRAK